MENRSHQDVVLQHGTKIPSKPAEINLFVKYYIQWGRATDSAGTPSLVTESFLSHPIKLDPRVFPLGLTEIDMNLTTGIAQKIFSYCSSGRARLHRKVDIGYN